MNKAKTQKSLKPAERVQKTSAESVNIDLSDIESVRRLPASACASVNRAIVALTDDERLDFVRRYIKGMPRLSSAAGGTTAMSQMRPCYGSFLSLLRGAADLVENNEELADFFKTLSPELTPNEYLSQILFRRREREANPFDPDNINEGFFRIRRARADIVKKYEKTGFREMSTEDMFKSLVSRH